EVTGFSYILSKKKRDFVIISIYFCKRNLKYLIGVERFPIWFQWSPVIIECMEAKIFIGVRNHVRYRQVSQVRQNCRSVFTSSKPARTKTFWTVSNFFNEKRSQVFQFFTFHIF